MLMLMSYFAYTLSYGYLEMDFLTNLFNTLFNMLTYLIIPFFLLMIYFLIANWIRDSKIADALSGGLRFKDAKEI